ncbi:tubulin-specific chaperone C [Onthophagus taurus]|uniref:tubulin-specific chaperone C n=1 Tax=Onthophagus taurus TaxID=166361 RepID=UPI0039BE52E7
MESNLLQERCDRKIEMLTKRENERKQDLEKGNALKKLTNAENEQLSYFEKSFNEKKSKIEQDLNKSSEIKIKDLPEHFDKISKDILSLQKYLAGSNLFLRGYDIKIYQQIVQNLGNQFKDIEDELIPKKKFGFKNIKTTKNKIEDQLNNIKNGESSKIDEVDSSIIKKNLFTTTCDLIDKSNETLSLDSTDIYKKDIALTNLTNCKVKLLGTPSTLHINKLKDCYIFTGPVSTSIFAENCFNCTLIIACQQLRLHSSENVRIYLHVTSRAIMEDCNQIFLAPYNYHYKGIDEDFEKAGLNQLINNWTSIDDFNWLNIERASPHWSCLNENERVSDWED